MIFGKDDQQHDELLSAVLSTLKRAGLSLNQTICVYRKQEVKFLGHIFSSEGIKADPEKVSTINNMHPPKSTNELRQFMGMVHYLDSYLPNLHSTTAPLNDLLKSDRNWSWDSPQEIAFKETKQLIASTPVLSYYDVTKSLTVSADASSFGLG